MVYELYEGQKLKNVNVCVPISLIERAEKICKQEMRSRNSFIVYSIRERVDKIENENKINSKNK